VTREVIVGTAAVRVATGASDAVSCSTICCRARGVALAGEAVDAAAEPGGVADRQAVEARAQLAQFVAGRFGHSGNDRRTWQSRCPA
jgi:hypothetical protein